MTTVRLSAQYAGRLVLAYLLSVSAAFVIVVPLGGITLSGTHPYFTEMKVATAVSSVIVGTIAVAIGGVVNIAGTLRWFVAERRPDQTRSNTERQ